MFGVVPKSIWNKLNPADENNMCSWALRCLLVEDGNRLILIDTGMGNKQDAKFFGHYYLHGNDTLDASLHKYGFHKADITDVFITHLHFDHCGGCITKQGDKLIPAFPNAKFWSHANHWQWATHPNDREKASFLKENILPIQESGQLNLIESSNTSSLDNGLLPQISFLKDITIRLANGHTNNMMLPQIYYKGKSIVFMADLLPSAEHIPLPYVMAYDMFPNTTLTEKKSFLQEATDSEYILFLEHDPINECCTVQQTEKGFRKKACFPLSQIL